MAALEAEPGADVAVVHNGKGKENDDENDDNLGMSGNDEFDDEDGDGDWGDAVELSDTEALNLNRKRNEKEEKNDIVDGTSNGENIGANIDAANIGAENPAGEGGRPIVQLNDLKQKEKCWVCEQCFATNNLKETYNRGDFKCINGCNSFNAANPYIIFLSEWDHEITKEEKEKYNNLSSQSIYACWKCPKCDWVNSVESRQCVIRHCQYKRVEASCPIEYLGTQPWNPNDQAFAHLFSDNVIINDNNNNNNKNNKNKNNENEANINNLQNYQNNNANKIDFQRKKLVSQKNKTINELKKDLGKTFKANEYPSSFSTFEHLDGPLRQMFGLPYHNLYYDNGSSNYLKEENGKKMNHIHGQLCLYGIKHEPIGSNNLNFINFKGEGNNNNNDNNDYKNKNVFNFDAMTILSHRNVAINQYNGWYALLMLDSATGSPYICVFQPNGSFGYQLVSFRCISDIIEAKQKNELDSILRSSRIRIIGQDNNIFLFIYRSERFHIRQYKVQLLNNDNSQRYMIAPFNQWRDTYITRAQVSDIDVVTSPDLVAILFHKWVGYYRIDMNDPTCELKWFHAVGIAKSGTVGSHSLTVISEDCGTLPWSVESRLMEMRESESRKGMESIMLDEKTNESLQEKLSKFGNDKEWKEIEESRNEFDVLKKVNEIDFVNARFKYEYNEKREQFQRFTNRFHIFFCVQSSLLSVHPTNPNYDYALWSLNMDQEPDESIYCVSKKYGTFYTNGFKNAIYHSSSNENKLDFAIANENNSRLFYDLIDSGNPSVQTKYLIGIASENLIEIENEAKNDDVASNRVFMTIVNDPKFMQLGKESIVQICDLSYDESYGISGRLLLYCQEKKDEYHGGLYCMQQFFNLNELEPFEKELKKLYLENDSVAFCQGMIPGTNEVPFNMIVETYRFLYGNEMIDQLMDSIYFNFGKMKEKHDAKSNENDNDNDVVIAQMQPGSN